MKHNLQGRTPGRPRTVQVGDHLRRCCRPSFHPAIKIYLRMPTAATSFWQRNIIIPLKQRITTPSYHRIARHTYKQIYTYTYTQTCHRTSILLCRAMTSTGILVPGSRVSNFLFGRPKLIFCENFFFFEEALFPCLSWCLCFLLKLGTDIWLRVFVCCSE